MKKIGVLGAGTWGMALARVLADAGHRVTVWSAIEREIDEFSGDNTGLVVAELELPTENTPYIRPDWLGEEVTGDIRYYNSNLIKNPYSRWKN